MGLADRHPSGSGEDLKNSSLDRVRDFTWGSPHQEATLWEPDPEETHPPHAECAFSRGHWPPAGHGPRPLTHSSLIQTLTATKHLLCARHGRGARGTETQNVTALAVPGEARETCPWELCCHVTRWMLNSAGRPAGNACPKPTWPQGQESPLWGTWHPSSGALSLEGAAEADMRALSGRWGMG